MLAAWLWNVFGFIGVAAVVLGALWLWGQICEAAGKTRGEKKQRMIDALHRASSERLAAAISVLLAGGMGYCARPIRKWLLPKYFWQYGHIEEKAKAILTIFNFTEGIEHGPGCGTECLEDLARLLLKKVRKYPREVLALTSTLSRLASDRSAVPMLLTSELLSKRKR